jgi:hypothetical protein
MVKRDDRYIPRAVLLRYQLLWIDCMAGASAGTLMLTLHRVLASWYGVPVALLLGMGAVNLGYASCSWLLARRSPRPPRLVATMAMANMAWAPVCLALAWSVRETATVLGFLSLGFEACFVGLLGWLEWRYRALLSEPGPVRPTVS